MVVDEHDRACLLANQITSFFISFISWIKSFLLFKLK